MILDVDFILCCHRTIYPVMIDQAYVEKKNEVIKAERRLLKELGFCVYVKHPHKVKLKRINI